MERRTNGMSAIGALLVGLVLALVPGIALAGENLDPDRIVRATSGYGTVEGQANPTTIVQATGGYGTVVGSLGPAGIVQATGGYGTLAGRAGNGWIVRATSGYGTVTPDRTVVAGEADERSFPWTLALAVGLVIALAVATSAMVRRRGPFAPA